MKKAHHFFLVFRRAGFNYGADKHLKKSPSDSINANGKENSQKGVRHYFRQDREENKPRCGGDVRDDNRRAIADFVDKQRRKGVNQKLYHKIDGDKQSYF